MKLVQIDVKLPDEGEHKMALDFISAFTNFFQAVVQNDWSLLRRTLLIM